MFHQAQHRVIRQDQDPGLGKGPRVGSARGPHPVEPRRPGEHAVGSQAAPFARQRPVARRPVRVEHLDLEGTGFPGPEDHLPGRQLHEHLGMQRQRRQNQDQDQDAGEAGRHGQTPGREGRTPTEWCQVAAGSPPGRCGHGGEAPTSSRSGAETAPFFCIA